MTDKHRSSIPILLLLLGVHMLARADIAVIVSAQSNLSAMTHVQVADLFLGRTTAVSNGKAIQIVDQSEGSATRGEFYLKAIGKIDSQMKSYWTRMIFTGRSQPPIEIGDNEAVKRMVAQTPQLIGYIDTRAVDSSVKILATFH